MVTPASLEQKTGCHQLQGVSQARVEREEKKLGAFLADVDLGKLLSNESRIRLDLGHTIVFIDKYT